MLRIDMIHFRAKSGMAALEFLLTFPLFLFSILITIEVCLIFIDQHLLRSSAFAAARYLSIAAEPETNQFYEISTEEKCEDNLPKEVMDRSRAIAAFKMSAVAPSTTFIGLTVGHQLEIYLNEMSAKHQMLAPYLSIIHGVPSARALVSISKCHITKNGIEIAISYFHFPRMPFAGNLVGLIGKSYHTNNKIENADDQAPQQGSETYLGSQIKNQIVQTASYLTDRKLRMISLEASTTVEWAQDMIQQPDFWDHQGDHILIAPYSSHQQNADEPIQSWVTWAKSLANRPFDWL